MPKKNTYERKHAAMLLYRDNKHEVMVYMPDSYADENNCDDEGRYGLDKDYHDPKVYMAMQANYPHRLIRVEIDHDATGTAGVGTGNTVVRTYYRGYR